MDTSTLECFSYVQQEFLICITVHKARNLIQFNSDTYVKITLDKISKTTNVFENSENPIYNEYFVFELFCALSELLRMTVLFEVKRKAKIKKDAVLGELFVELRTVWGQQNRSFYKKWGKLENPIGGKPPAALRGHLQFDLSIVSKNNPPAPAFFNDHDFDDIEKNLLQPTIEQKDILSVQYNVIIYKGFFFKKLDYLIQVSFAGMSGKTKVLKSKTNNEWNEQISFMWSYPALSQTFLIQVMAKEATHWRCLADYEIHFEDVTFPGQLPSVGPTYIYLYDSLDKKSYIGRVLMAIKSENIKGKENIPQRVAKNHPAPPVSEKILCGIGHFFIECLIWQGDFIHSNSTSIKFGLNFGEYSSQEIQCQPHMHMLTNWRFFQQESPYKTIYLTTPLPDCRCKFEADHFLFELLHIIKTEMDHFKVFELKYSGQGQLHAKYLRVLVTLFGEKLKQGKYRLVYQGFKQLTEWDKNRHHFLEQFYKNLQNALDNYRKSLKLKNPECLENVSKVYRDLLIKTREIDTIIGSRIQDNLPDLILNVCVGSRVVAYSKLDCRKFMYAKRREGMGMLCGKRHNIVLKPTTCHHTCRSCGCIFAKIDAWIWIGTESERNDSMEKQGWIPQGPFFYNVNDMRNFDCKLYIHQAKIRPGGDKTGLCDPKIRATFFHLAADTSVVQTSLSPVWDEVISFYNIMLPGPPESYLENPPMVALEVLDRDSRKTSDFLGNGFIRLSVKLLEDSSSPLQEVYTKSIGKEDNEPIKVENKLNDFPLLFKKNLQTREILKTLKEICRVSPPPLKWIPTFADGTSFAEILISGELIESKFDNQHSETTLVSKGIPPQICPSNKLYRISAFFAGIRNFQKSPNVTAGKYKIKIIFGDLVMYSGASASKLNISINFLDPCAAGFASLPAQMEYWPAIIITHVDVSHKKEITVGAALISKPGKYLDIQYDYCESSIETKFLLEDSDVEEVDYSYYEERIPLLKKEKVIEKKTQYLAIILKFIPKLFYKCFKDDGDISYIDHEDEEKTFNWWTKFYNSVRKTSEIVEENVLKHKLIIYPSELEKQPEFDYFRDWAEPIPLTQRITKRKYSSPKDESYCILKCQIRINSYIESFAGRRKSENSLKNELTNKFQEQSKLLTEMKVVVRIYIVQGLKLRSRDRFSQSDAFIGLQFGTQKISDRANYVPNQVDPIFGKRFQMDGLIPREHILHISVYDHGVQDDLIGCTCIDLEDRLRSKHYASFGIPNEFCSTGYNVWRNLKSPYTILKEICNRYGLAPPEFKETKIIVAGITFEDSTKIAKNESIRERLSLSVLKRLDEIPDIGFKLVPEHVETRSLYRKDRPGIEQGKLQLWVEIFEADKVPAPIDITPILAKTYELRVIIYSTKDVIIDEKNLFGKAMSDIFIKAWVEDIDAAQHTDVHYRSLNGEGNFNWRMIFPMRYSKNEEMIWDNDVISADDFLGALNLDLTHCPVPTATPKHCTNKPSKYLNLFKVKKIRGWFPAMGKTKDGSVGLTGKVELEMQILTETEAEATPAGKGRDPPNALPAPNRPETSFNWITNPLKALKYILLPQIKKCCCWCSLLLIVFLIIYGFITGIPNFLL